MSQITTHVLDTSIGKPAQGIKIALHHKSDNEKWEFVSSGVTDEDGRIANLLEDDVILKSGVYRMLFETATYFNQRQIEAFYPIVPVIFEIRDSQHYHVPLLLNPFGYSTYRGS